MRRSRVVQHIADAEASETEIAVMRADMLDGDARCAAAEARVAGLQVTMTNTIPCYNHPELNLPLSRQSAINTNTY